MIYTIYVQVPEGRGQTNEDFEALADEVCELLEGSNFEPVAFSALAEDGV